MNPRIAHDSPLGSSGPSPIRRALRVLGAGVLGAAVVTLGGLGAHFAKEGEAWMVRDVAFSGNAHVSDTALRHLSDIRRGDHLYGVDLDRAILGIEGHPWVAHAEARRRFPGTVEISVVEHTPKMLMAVDALWYVDAQGVPFVQATSALLDLPILTGLSPELTEQRPDLARAVVDGGLRVLDAVEQHQSLDPDQVSELRFDARIGFLLVLRSGTELVLGFGDPMVRLDRLDQLIAAGLDPDSPQRVDLDAERVAVATPLPSLD